MPYSAQRIRDRHGVASLAEFAVSNRLATSSVQTSLSNGLAFLFWSSRIQMWARRLVILDSVFVIVSVPQTKHGDAVCK
jgi:hypothetical protein